MQRGRAAVSDASWRAYLHNCGVWAGKRALVDARGKVLLDVPTTVRTAVYATPDGEPFVVWRTSVKTEAGADEVEEEWSRDELSELGALTEDASFSAGADCFVGERFSVEHCLFDRHDDLRVRATFAYDWEGRLTGLVSSRERRVDDNSAASPSVTFIEPAAWRSPTVLLDYSVGVWRGQGVVLDSKTHTTRTIESIVDLSLEMGGVLVQKSQINVGSRPSLVVEASARMDENTALFAEANMQLMFLPGGVSIACPIRIWPGISFTLELTHISRPNVRRRLLRCYDESCNWVQTVFITELRVG